MLFYLKPTKRKVKKIEVLIKTMIKRSQIRRFEILKDNVKIINNVKARYVEHALLTSILIFFIVFSIILI